MTKKLTQKEWFDKFDTEFSKEIDKFRISGTTLFDNEDTYSATHVYTLT